MHITGYQWTTLTKINAQNRNENHNTDKQIQGRKTQKTELITEFTPSTGLRLLVPLQWVSIQLMVLKGTKWFWKQLQ